LWKLVSYFKLLSEKEAVDAICRGRVKWNGVPVQTPGMTLDREFDQGVHSLECGNKKVEFYLGKEAA
jgi:hypothetical protein